MPYVSESDREVLDPFVEELSARIGGVRDLNYVITRLVMRRLLVQGVNYEDINASLGVLVVSMLEIYRRVGTAYEDLKIFQNGDVPEFAELASLIRKIQHTLPTTHVADKTQVHG
jgi:hypothetical protein